MLSFFASIKVSNRYAAKVSDTTMFLKVLQQGQQLLIKFIFQIYQTHL